MLNLFEELCIIRAVAVNSFARMLSPMGERIYIYIYIYIYVFIYLFIYIYLYI